MAGSKERLVIVGNGETAKLAYDYFTEDSPFKVVAFSAETAYVKQESLFGLPVVPLESIEQFYNPKTHSAFVAVSFTNLNRLRKKLVTITKAKGYTLVKYISSKASVNKNSEIGENCFILENVVIQRGVKIGDNVTIWSGSSIGHQSIVGNNCFLAMHVAVSGFCKIGENCFLGVNSCIAHNLTVSNDCMIGAGAVLIRDTEVGEICVGNPAKPLLERNTYGFISGEQTI